MYMLVHSLASKYARDLGYVLYPPPPIRPLFGPPLLKCDDLFFREPRDIGPPPFKNPGHAPALPIRDIERIESLLQLNRPTFHLSEGGPF